MKRVILFIATNLAVMLVLSIVLKVLGLDRALYAQAGVSYGGLLVASVVVGFTGAIISLLMSKSMAKWSTGARVITQPSSEPEAWLLETVRKLATTAGVSMPEVAIYEGAPNAFATGAFKNSALVAVSTGLLQSMNKEEVEAVLGHELAHVANGDMVTLTLIQGVVNTFVIFLSRIVGGIGYFVTVMFTQMVLGVVASLIVMWFSRRREFRADAGGARLAGRENMINALRALRRLHDPEVAAAEASRAQAFQSLKISGQASGLLALFATHPPLEQRIARLEQGAY